MATTIILGSSSKRLEDTLQSASNTGLITWKSILHALQHPLYTSPSLKAALISQISKLRNCSDAYSFKQAQSSTLGDSVIIEGTKYDLSPQQKELVDKLSEEAQLDSLEACKIVLQQSRLGVVGLASLMKAYMEERTAILRVVKRLLRTDAYDITSWKSGNLAKEIVPKLKENKDFSLNLVDGIRKRVEQPLPPSVMADPALALLWSRQILLEEHELLELLFLTTEKEKISSRLVRAWFNLLRDTLFFSNQLNVRLDSDSVAEIMRTIQAFSAIISIRFSSLSDTNLTIIANDKSHFFSDPESIIQIQDTLKYLATEIPLVAPVALNWALTIHRLFSALTEEGEELPNSHVRAFSKLFETDDGLIEWHRFFAQLAFEYNAFEVIILLLNTLSGEQSSAEIRQIVQSLFFSTFHMIPFNDIIISTFDAIHSDSPELSKLFWEAAQQDTASPASDLLFAVRSRFPLSLLPHINLLASSLHSSTKETIFSYFQSLPTYTQTLQRGFTGYDIIEEERDNTLITLKSDLRVFTERDDGEGAVIVQTGTVGRLLSRGESVPTVMWEWPFNGWALIGRVLEMILTNGVTNVISTDELCHPVLLGIFKLLEGVLAGSNAGVVEGVVASTSEEMAQEWDVISVTFEIVSQVLEVLDIGAQSRADLEYFLTIAEGGIKVLAGAVLGREASIWSLIVKGGAKWWGRISRIGISAEMSSQVSCMPVTTAAIGLVNALFSAAVRNVVLSDGFSAHLRREVLWLAGTYVLDVWIGFNEWKYLVAQQRFEIGTKLCYLFENIVSQVYTIDAAHSPENRVTGILAPTADRILEMFLSQDDDIARPFEALFYACFVAKEVFESRDNGLEGQFVVKAEKWCAAALSLAEKIVRTRFIVSPDSLGFELQIYRQLKLLNSLLFIRPSLQAPVFTLLKTLLMAPQPESREQPSILAHLGGDEKTHIPLLIELVSDPFVDPETRTAVWRYASGVVASQQQGLAILLLFGAETSRKVTNKPAVVEDKEEIETLLRKAITTLVEDDLKLTHFLERQVLDGIMEFISKAHNSWAPILSTLRQDKALWAKLLILLAWSGLIVDNYDSSDQTLQKCWQLRTAAAAVDAIAVEIFHAGNMARAASIEVLRNHFVVKKDVKLKDIASEAFRIRGYRDSLFFHLRRNFQNKFPSADVLLFQRNTIHDRQFGEEYFFDISVGKAVLGEDPAWEGFEKEIRLANLNMSIVDAQLELLTSWQHLALAWDENGQKALPLEGRAVTLAKACLEANISEAKMCALLHTTVCERANLAFSLIGNSSANMTHGEFETVLRLAFNALVAPEFMFFDSLADGKFDLSRPLLRIIATCLKRFGRSDERSSRLLQEIFEAIVAKGASNLLNRARMHPNGAVADMFGIVVAIGQEVVDLCGKDIVASELCNKLMDHNSIETAVRLYATSDQALIDDQPIFAELSLQYMVMLCSIPRVPEQLAVAGILAYIMESPISSVLQSTDIRTAQCHVLHRVWTRGVLPIIFNLLQSLGSRILRDTIAFLRLYEYQIQSAFTEWARPKLITTALVDETLLLLVMFDVVDTYLQLEQDRFVFRGKEDLLENVNNLLAHPRFLARLVHPTTPEEEKMMEEKKEGEYRNGLVAKIAEDLEEMRGLLGAVEH